MWKYLVSHIHILIMSIAVLCSWTGLIILNSFDTVRLSGFGPTAQIYFKGLEQGFLVSSIILTVALLIFCMCFDKILSRLKTVWQSQSNTKKTALVLLLCIIFAFGTHAGNIVNGYFNMDDFEIVGINHTTSFGQSLLIPHGNDHTMPLFMAEMRMLDVFFDQNPLPYNLFVFFLFALIPFFTYLTFQRLRISSIGFIVFLVVFTGATGWADMLTGFNIMSTYTQIILFFAIAIWAYTAWKETSEKKYMLFFTVATISALTIDLPGIWIIPALFLYMLCLHGMEYDSYRITRANVQDFFRKNKTPLIIFTAIIIAFALFIYYTFTVIQPNTFLSTLSDTTAEIEPSLDTGKEQLKPLPLITNFFSFFSSGVSLPIIAPNIQKLMAHPSLQGQVAFIWPALEIGILILNAFLGWFILKKSNQRFKKYSVLLMLLIGITVLMVIVARPNHEAIPDFDYRYAGAPFYAYCILLALASALCVSMKKEYGLKIILSLVVVIFGSQQAFGFHANRLKEEAKVRKETLTRLNSTLLQELDSGSSKNGASVIPNLSGAYILQAMPGFSLADYVLFFDRKMPIKLIRNEAMAPDVKSHSVVTVESLRASTSPSFKENLKQSAVMRSYYLSPALLGYSSLEKVNASSPNMPAQGKEIVFKKEKFDPEKIHRAGFTLHTDNASGNLELAFSFKNDFNTEEKLGKIRIDDYTNYVLEDNKRVYFVETDLLQLYAFSLSEYVSNLILHIPEHKNARISNFYLK